MRDPRPIPEIERDYRAAGPEMSWHYAEELVQAQRAEIERLRTQNTTLAATVARQTETIREMERVKANNAMMSRRRMAEIERLRRSVIAFGAPWAAERARAHGLPDGHLFPAHYDILAEAGARMDDFTRATGGSAERG